MPGIAGGKAISVEVDISLISFFQWFWGNYRQIWHRQAAGTLEYLHCHHFLGYSLLASG
jgi:hypothetical protein